MKKRVLVVEDDAITLEDFVMILKKAGYEATGAMTIEDANRLIAASLRSGKFFHIAFLDLNVGSESGGEFGRRIRDIIPNMNVVIITAFPNPAALLPYTPDAVIIKPADPETLVSIAKEMVNPLRRKSSSDNEAAANHWIATQQLSGFNDLKVLSRTVNSGSWGYVEKIISKASDGEFISTVIYWDKKVGNRILNIALSSLIGCKGLCKFCRNWQNRTDDCERPVAFKRQLTEGEIAGQVLIAFNNKLIRKAFRKGSEMKIIFRYTCEGDGLVWNLDNCCKVFRKLSMIEQPNVGFNFTSIGSVDSLKKYITNYIHLPGTSHYWSKDTLDPKKTKWLRPGMLDDSQEEMRDLYEYIAKVTKIPVTISWVLIRGFNDQPEDVRMIADFFRGRPFEIKLMALVKGSLSGFKDTTAGDLQRFKKQLDEVGVPARIRAIWGTKIHAQCGGTIIPWLRNKQYDFQPFYDEV